MGKTVVLQGLTPEVTVHAFVDLVDSQIKFKAIFKRPSATDALKIKAELTRIMTEQIDERFQDEKKSAELTDQANNLIKKWLIRCEALKTEDNKAVDYSDELLDQMLGSVGYAKSLGNALGRAANSLSDKNSLRGN